jgi:hypothetical protein
MRKLFLPPSSAFVFPRNHLPIQVKFFFYSGGGIVMGAIEERREEQLGELRRENKRIRKSRDNLKEKNREKSKMIREKNDRLTEVIEGREGWKKKHQESKKEVKRLKDEEERHLLEQAKNDKTIEMLLEELKKKHGN